MPHYLVEVRERAEPERVTSTRPTLWTHETPEDMWYEVGHRFQVEGRMLKVTHIEGGRTAVRPAARLCTGRPVARPVMAASSPLA